MLTLDTKEAVRADQISSAIAESGKFIGEITRAEKLVAESGAEGVGISFRSDTGETADYLDLYIRNGAGETLASNKHVMAILACLKLRQINEGAITCEKYNKDTKSRERVSVNGYPELMGKRIGFLFQKQLESHYKTGEDTTRINIFGVFQADTELTASEILDRKTGPEKLQKMVAYLAEHPVRDIRKNKPVSQPPQTHTTSNSGFGDFDDDIPF